MCATDPIPNLVYTIGYDIHYRTPDIALAIQNGFEFARVVLETLTETADI